MLWEASSILDMAQGCEGRAASGSLRGLDLCCSESEGMGYSLHHMGLLVFYFTLLFIIGKAVQIFPFVLDGLRVAEWEVQGLRWERLGQTNPVP